MPSQPHLPKPLIRNIAFFGDADVPQRSPVWRDAYEIAKILGSKGFTIVNGGGPGVMNASTQGADAGGGETISVTFSPENATGFEGRYVANVTDKEIITTNYTERMFKLMEHADLYIIFKGGSGTMSEFGTAWVLAKLYYGHHKPFILFGSFWKEIVDSLVRNMNIDKDEMSVFKIVEKREDVFPAVEEFERKLREIDHSKCKVCNENAYMN